MKLSLKHTLYIALLVAFGSRADAAALLVEGFNYAAGVGLPAPWTSSNGVILATSPGLTLPGLADTVPTGNKVSIVPNGVSSYTQTSPFTPVSSGSVYCGFL